MDILIIDDHQDIHYIFKRYLQDIHKHKVFHAYNGKEGLKILQKRNIDHIFCDVHMPVMDGLKFLDEITNAFSSYKKHITIMSGKISKTIEDIAHDKDISILGKPFCLEDINQMLNIQALKF